MKDQTVYYLFVYGTLRKGMSNNIKDRIVNDVQWIGEAEIRGRLYDIGNYPGAVPADNEDKAYVKGEILKLNNPETILKILDDYEGIDPDKPDDCEYRRGQYKICLPDGKEVNTWIYWYNLPVEGKVRIREQDYLVYLKEKKSAEHGG
jgi:gamma-glutamylcyclotransferase (GGCT)/AIG2-like uncharacterized protein YtfP